MITLERLLTYWMGGLMLCALLLAGLGVQWAWTWARVRWSARELGRIPTRWL